ncbi:hypothetical protein [Paenibacillus sp. OV219]|uniref:hypothetical protein n=1 Tax=Paenibacillus sp. OV219 TaxID=1884377 RepID=UPI0008CA74AD|nr:hypothetical protein [Paenibacillus sp. OV219]SEO35922.1 hypothetical protein SAMN05518847_107192 [Paenibacillus sp. OV219]
MAIIVLKEWGFTVKGFMKLVVLLCGLVVLLAACGGKTETPLSVSDKVSTTDLSAEKGGAAELGMTEKELVDKLGKPERALNEGRTFLLMYESYQYTTLDSKVLGYSIGPEAATARGVKLGDSKEQVLKQYGDAYYTLGESIGYIDKTKQLSLDFKLKDDKVVAINLASLELYE